MISSSSARNFIQFILVSHECSETVQIIPTDYVNSFQSMVIQRKLGRGFVDSRWRKHITKASSGQV